MNLKETLINLKNKLQAKKEFFAILENHELGEQTMYRLHYLEYYDDTKYGYTDFTFRPFYLPEGMNRMDAFKVLSYLKDEIEKHLNMRKNSVHYLDMYLDTLELGFKRVDFTPSESEIIDVFFVIGKIEEFEKSEYYKRYYNWYIPNVEKKQVEKIYNKLNRTFKDPILKKLMK